MGVDRVKRIFQAFGTSGLIFVQVRPHLLDGKEYYDLVARVIADLLCKLLIPLAVHAG